MSASDSSDALFLELQSALAGRYSLDRELGRGGMGVVFLAHDVDLDRLVAIKLLPPAVASCADTRDRFLREARMAARLSHPHIIPIHAVEQVGAFVFYVMGYIDGETLTQRVAARGPLTAGEGARVLREVSWALSYAHAQGIVHRDIKPDNILLDRESGHAVVADFGIAAAMGSTADVACGTPEFMSPEQALDRPVDARSDLYALGATAFFAFTGRPPFSGNSATEIIARHVADAAPLLSQAVMTVPRPLAQLVDRCLAKEPAQRPQSAQQVADALSSALEKRRELPAVLRAFVKRDGRMDGAGTMLTLFGALVGGVGISSVTSDLVGIGVMLGVAAAAPVVFSLSAARRLLSQGYRHGDLAPAFQSELETLREERTVSPRRAMRAVEWTLGRLVRVGASTTLALTPFFCGRLREPRPRYGGAAHHGRWCRDAAAHGVLAHCAANTARCRCHLLARALDGARRSGGVRGGTPTVASGTSARGDDASRDRVVVGIGRRTVVRIAAARGPGRTLRRADGARVVADERRGTAPPVGAGARDVAGRGRIR
jgi:serine/threonine-protein kinase